MVLLLGFGWCGLVLRVLGFVLITVGCGFERVYAWRGFECLCGLVFWLWCG